MLFQFFITIFSLNYDLNARTCMHVLTYARTHACESDRIISPCFILSNIKIDDKRMSLEKRTKNIQLEIIIIQ